MLCESQNIRTIFFRIAANNKVEISALFCSKSDIFFSFEIHDVLLRYKIYLHMLYYRMYNIHIYYLNLAPRIKIT